MSSSTNEIEVRRVCAGCIGEAFLRAEINRDGKSDICFYCGKADKTITVGELADRVELAFEQHFQRSSTDPSDVEYSLLSDKESSYDWSRHGEPVVDVILNLLDSDNDLASDIQNILEERHSDYEMAKMGEECPFDSESYYEEARVSTRELQEQWASFENSLKTETRFFNAMAETTLSTIFEGLSEHKTWNRRRIIVSAGPKRKISFLYRARVFESDDDLVEALKRPDVGLGPPPLRVARSGRMNAVGISVFYGATDARIALAEVRPPGGSRVAVARFEIIQPIRLLDVEALRTVLVQGSYFDPRYLSRLERARFLGSLSHRITAPVMPSDEPFDYLATQAIADYLATQKGLDGIIYPSAQAKKGKNNVVLFHHSARVQSLEFPTGTELEAYLHHSTEDESDFDYSVWEQVPPTKEAVTSSEISKMPPLVSFEYQPTDSDYRVSTLRIETEEVRIHHVESVIIKSQSFTVRRHRSEKRDLDFGDHKYPVVDL